MGFLQKIDGRKVGVFLGAAILIVFAVCVLWWTGIDRAVVIAKDENKIMLLDTNEGRVYRVFAADISEIQKNRLHLGDEVRMIYIDVDPPDGVQDWLSLVLTGWSLPAPFGAYWVERVLNIRPVSPHTPLTCFDTDSISPAPSLHDQNVNTPEQTADYINSCQEDRKDAYSEDSGIYRCVSRQNKLYLFYSYAKKDINDNDSQAFQSKMVLITETEVNGEIIRTAEEYDNAATKIIDGKIHAVLSNEDGKNQKTLLLE